MKERLDTIYDLAFVMPVYNEEACIAAVVQSWREILGASGIRFIMLIINDGSSDGTADILQRFASDRHIRVIHQTNRGHGPSILTGYRQAAQLAEWIFQSDSDNEMDSGSFSQVWDRRLQAEAVLGSRQQRQQSVQRKLVSSCSRMAVRLLFGPGIEDANVPYRLMHGSVLRPILAHIPPETFAPNVMLSGALVLMGGRIRNVPVPCRSRRTGCVSLGPGRLWKAALRSFRQILLFRWQIRGMKRKTDER